MSEEKPNVRSDQVAGPICPGSPLYRLLELIALAIAEQRSGQPLVSGGRTGDLESPT